MVAAWKADAGAVRRLEAGRTIARIYPSPTSSMNKVIASIAPGCCSYGSRLGEDLVKLKRAEIPEVKNIATETKIANAVGNEGFLLSSLLGVAFVTMGLTLPFSQTRHRKERSPNPFPANQCHQEVVGADEQHHRGNKEVHEDEEARLCTVVSVLWRTSA